MIVVVMGVSGVGKTTLGRALAERLEATFLEGDRFHPPANVEKMRRSCPFAWCSWCCSPSLRGQGWPGHTVTADSAATGLSPIGAMVSRLM